MTGTKNTSATCAYEPDEHLFHIFQCFSIEETLTLARRILR